ncbi:ATP-dependent RNA helicase HrpA [Motiliproteus sp.]|uniref:ATP-dependent RNA helicase HrpA n=1 Tax=Motiliproteus sp. TaxID=1898955 RepID=UPI003BA85508
MTDPFKSLSVRLDQCLLQDQQPLKQLLKGIRRNAKAGKPYDRLQGKFETLAEASEARRLQRSQPIRPQYDDSLPICQKREQILELIREHQVIVLAGETGSGKTTQLPKFCLELGRGSAGLIGHTQPRRLAARAVASRIAEELGEAPGHSVGYQVRFDDTLGEQSRVKLMTDGILLAEIQHDRLLQKYDTLIIDEAHERSLNIDFLLGFLKRLLPQRPDLKLIITSATIDVQRFSKHFDDAPVLEVSGRTYPVEVLYRPPELQKEQQGEEDGRTLNLPQRIQAAVEEIEQLESAGKGHRLGDVLVFLPGEREIRESAEQLRKAVTHHQLRDLQVLPLYARLSQGEQNKIFNPSGRGRRVVLATNVAETSLTVPGIRYVIDAGVARISRYSVRSKIQRLPIEPISQASANQRKGRCGRVSAGICIRLYSEEDFQSRSSFTDAEILRTNLAAVILQMEALGLGKMELFPFIDPPDSRQIRDGVRLLEELGAIQDDRLTKLGRQLSRLPVDPRVGRMLLEAARYDCLTEVLIVASVLTIQDPRERPHDKQQQADEKHRVHQDKDSDFVGFINLWNHYEEQRQELSQGQLRRYCQKQFLSFMRMREWRDLHRQLHLACKSLGLTENKQPAGYAEIHRSLLAGLLGHIGFRQENREYLGARNRKFMPFPGSVLAKGKAKWLMAAELVETSRLFARMAAKIEPGWIEPLAPHLLKRSYSEPHWEKKAAQVIAYERLTLYGLVVVPKRRVHFGAVDPEQARQIFIRSALVEGEFHTRAPFFKHNRELLDQVAALEDKSRRRDILVDEEQLYEFYLELMLKQGGDRVVNGASFEQWRKKLEQQDPKALFMTREALMRHSASGINQNQYPDYLEHEGLKFRLHYHFSPGAEDDGVSVDVPAAALQRLPLQRLQWLVPGLLRDKCIALVKNLPKSIRKQCVPVPDRVDRFLQDAAADNSSLTEALAHSLKRQCGVQIRPDDWNEENLETHFCFNIRVLDQHSKTLAQGRDWHSLAERFAGQQHEQQADPRADSEWQRTGITEWDFGELPQQVELEQAGMKIPAFPALTVTKEGLNLSLHASQQQALEEHRWGLVRLMQLRTSRQQREMTKRLPELQRSTLLFGKLGRREQLEADFFDALYDRVFIQPRLAGTGQQQLEALPRQAGQFEALYKQQLANLVPEAEVLSQQLHTLLLKYQAINKKLSGSIQLAWAPILNDIREQLSGLIYLGFMKATPASWWQRMPLYLKAIEIRLQKYQQQLNQQRLHSEQLQRLWQGYCNQQTRMQQAGISSAPLVEYRWMLEEYRISLFAQQLGTLKPVSDKRLKQLFDQCQI